MTCARRLASICQWSASILVLLLLLAGRSAAASPELVSAGALQSVGTTGSTHAILYFPSASDPLGRQGFARIVNRSGTSGTVTIDAFDDAGRNHGPVTLALDAGETAHFNSDDLEDGNAVKGLEQGTGRPSEGDWRLKLNSDLDIMVLSYIRTSDGFVTAMHDVAPAEGNTYAIVFFNPGSNTAQASVLRLVNAGIDSASVTIHGVDDLGERAGPVRLSVPAGAARTVSAAEMEAGGVGLTGALGDGAGKWRLEVEADHPIMALSILDTPTGHLTNLSTVPELVTVRSGGDDDHGDDIGSATSVSVPSTTGGELEEGGDMDYFLLSVSEATTLTVGTTGSTDTHGTLFDGDGDSLDTDDDGGAGTNFEIGRDVDAGTYYVEVRGYSSGTTGTYELDVSAGSGGGGDDYCRDGDVVQSGGRCDIYTTSFWFEVSGTRGCLRAGGIILCAGNSLTQRGSLNGVRVTLVAARNDDGSWTIDDVDPEPD